MNTPCCGRRRAGGYELFFGEDEEWGGKVAALKESHGVMHFSTGDRYDVGSPEYDECDEIGCGNVLRIEGVLDAGEDGPVIVAYYTLLYPNPEDESSPVGTLMHVSRMRPSP